MKVVYTAPNRAHHYTYAEAMHEAGILKAFVSGFSRLSPRAALPEIGKVLKRADLLQTIYLLTIKARLPDKWTAWLAYWAKIEQDKACRKFLKGADIFLFYNGSGLSTCRYAKKKGIVTIVEVVNTHVDYQEKILMEEYGRLGQSFIPFHKQEKERRIQEYAAADYIMYPSEFVKQSFLQYGFPEEKMVKVSYGFNELPQRSLVKKEAGTFTILYVGSISVRKGLRYLVKAFEKLEHPGKKLVLVGPTQEITGLEDLKLTNNIILTGSLKGEALEQAYKSADVFCLPSIEDGFGLVIGEALSYGVPVIATTNTGAFEIITNGVNGYIVPIRDTEAILDKLEALAGNTELLNHMSIAALKTIESLNGWQTSKEQLVTVLYRCSKSE